MPLWPAKTFFVTSFTKTYISDLQIIVTLSSLHEQNEHTQYTSLTNAGGPCGLSRTSSGLEKIARGDMFLNIKRNIF